MELGGLRTDAPRAFLLSTTHGPETTGLAAYLAVAEAYRRAGRRGRHGAAGPQARRRRQRVPRPSWASPTTSRSSGRPSCLVFVTSDHRGRPSQEFRTLFLQEMLERGVLGQSFVISAAHTDDDVEPDGRGGR